jgi:predicted nucleic acid-binding Zn ribbon protein
LTPDASGFAITVVNSGSRELPKYWKVVVVASDSKSKIVVCAEMLNAQKRKSREKSKFFFMITMILVIWFFEKSHDI